MFDRLIEKSKRGESKLTPEILMLPGMSSAWNRHLLNNLVGIKRVNYLEVGVWQGSTFISALYGNEYKATAIDNFSQYQDEKPKDNFHDYCQRFCIAYDFIEKDCFEVDWLRDIDFFFYDGDHLPDKTAQSLTHFYNSFSDEFIYIADDYNWKGVREGVAEGIKQTGLKIEYQRWLRSENNDADKWWNGLGIFKFKK